jgi:hypothetical protein
VNKVKVKVFNSSGSAFMSGELCLQSGIIEYEEGYSHISAMVSQGRKVDKIVEPAVPEPIKEVEKPQKEVVISPPQSETPKKKKHKG